MVQEKKTQTEEKLIGELFKNQAHLGHKTNRIHPKAKKYIYKIENGVSIIDLELTAKLLNQACLFLSQLASEGKKLLFVATKRVVAVKALELCSKNNISYITTKWPAGFLTNFQTLMKNVNKLKKMREAKESGEWQKLVKHEQSNLERELYKLNKLYGGLSDIDKPPDALVLVDLKKEKNALDEARATGTKIIAIVDTNVNPELVDYPIPANDDSLPSVEFILNLLVDAYVKERKKADLKTDSES